MIPNQPQTKPAPTMGSIQSEFTYRLYSFPVNSQFTIVEDLPKNKPLRKKTITSTKTGKPFEVYLIRIISNGFEADLELYETYLATIAVACPRDTQNFKGITLAWNGQVWSYICSSMPDIGQNAQVAPQPQIAAKEREYYQLSEAIKYSAMAGTETNAGVVAKIAESIRPGNGIELIKGAKDAGYIMQELTTGIYRGTA